MSLVHKNDAVEFNLDGTRTVDHSEALNLLENGAVFVDVRRDIQYKTGHIPGAVGLELKSALTEENLLNHVAKDRQVVFYCSDKQCYRSAHANAMALSWGVLMLCTLPTVELPGLVMATPETNDQYSGICIP